MKKLSRNVTTGTIIIQPDFLFCSIITSGRRKPLHLATHTTIPCNHLELQHGYLFNPTVIDQALRKFFVHKNIPVAIALSGTGINEQLYCGTPSLPESTEQTSSSKKLHLFTHHVTQQPCWYTVTLPQPLLLQYQLLGIRLKRNLTIVTTHRMALLGLYHYCYGTAFRTTQLALDMYKRNNVIEALFEPEQIFHLIEHPNTILSSQEKQALFPAMGLAVMQGDTYEAN